MTDSPESSAHSAPPPITRNEAVAITLLGVDWGERRIGVAIKPAGQNWAVPSRVLEIRNEADGIAQLRRTIVETAPQGIVVGIPYNPDPAMARAARRFCRKTREGMTGVRWFFADETLTSQAANSISQESASRGPADDLAAKLILESFLQTCP